METTTTLQQAPSSPPLEGSGEVFRILTFTPVWQRPEVFEICLAGLKRLQQYAPERFSIRPFFIVSEARAALQIERYGFDFIFWQNLPVGGKKNAGLKYAMQNFEFDYLMELGSDDLVANSLLDAFEPYFEKGINQICPDNVWFIDVNSGQVAYWHTDRIIGLGRCMSKRVLERFAPEYQLWEPKLNRGLDNSSWFNLGKKQVGNNLVPMDGGVFTLDLKSEVNINTIDPFMPAAKTVGDVLVHFPEAGMIRELMHKRGANGIPRKNEVTELVDLMNTIR